MHTLKKEATRLHFNPIPYQRRLKELFYDYFVIIAYLLTLFILAMGFYFLVFGKISNFTEGQSQLIATILSVLPIILIFTFMDMIVGSLGKKKAGLVLIYKNPPLISAFIRNLIKFLPWQLGHMGTIAGIYTDYTSLSGHVFTALSLILVILMIVMGFFRKDKRHLGDLLAGTQVVVKKERWG